MRRTGFNTYQIDRMNLSDVISQVDWINVVTYKFHG